MKNSVKKVVKTTAILLLAIIFAGSPAISPITSKTTIEAEASAKSDKAVKNARKILKKYGIEDAESFYKFIERDDVTGCDWIRFLIEKGFLFNE